MTLATTTNREQYATDGVTTAFTIHFPFFDDSDVNAIFVDSSGSVTPLTLSTDFSVSGGNGAGGTLTTTAVLTTGGTLTVFRDIAFTQEDDYVENDPLPADTLESGFDRAAMRDQQLQDAVDRALTFPVTIDPSVSAVLPGPAPSQVLGWNSGGTALENKNLPAGTAVYSSTANTNLGTATSEAVTPKGLHDGVYNPNGKHLIPILAAAMVPSTSSPPGIGLTQTGTDSTIFRTLDFDQAVSEGVGFVLPWPKSSDETAQISYRVRWTADSGSGAVKWTLYAKACGDGDVIDGNFGGSTSVVDTKVASGAVHISAESTPQTIANTLVQGDLVFFWFGRLPSDAADTLTADARLLSLDLFITTNAGTDA